MSRPFAPQELEELRQDMRRNPGKRGLATVAQLHACTEQQVLEVLGLEQWPDAAPSPQPQKADARKRRYPDSLREKAVNDVLDGAESYATVADRYDVPTKTLYGWVQRSVQAKVTTTQANAEAAPAAPPCKERAPEPSVSRVTELRRGLAGLGEFVAAFMDTGLLDDAAMERLTLWSKEAKAFVAGAAYMEEQR